ncbi:MAG TPA: glycine zipper 2TM domain-containing protein [Rhodanobacteraceae bacterium]|jgi:outer membrane lipoprotein SlyB|nr:glycine zipper 2TM domain-containing protein [Rhodanobacteraceae bacterium]
MKSNPLFSSALVIALGLGATAAVHAQNGNGVLVRSDGIYVRCDSCGTVESIEQNITKGGGHGTAGAVVGAIAGGVLGNQVGKGKGKALATAGGAIGGGLAGHAIGNKGSQHSWLVRVRMGNGSYMNIQVKDASSLRKGDLVEVDGNGNITRIR